jgi:putative membrane protein
MAMIRNLLLIVLILVVVIVSAGFAWLNPGSIALDTGFGVLETTVSYAFIACFAIGWLFGLLSALFWAIRQAAQRRKLARQLRLAEAEVANLRQLPAADSD